MAACGGAQRTSHQARFLFPRYHPRQYRLSFPSLSSAPPRVEFSEHILVFESSCSAHIFFLHQFTQSSFNRQQHVRMHRQLCSIAHRAFEILEMPSRADANPTRRLSLLFRGFRTSDGRFEFHRHRDLAPYCQHWATLASVNRVGVGVHTDYLAGVGNSFQQHRAASCHQLVEGYQGLFLRGFVVVRLRQRRADR